jgi:uncharacterized membrane protein
VRISHRALLVVVGVLAVAAVIGMALLWPADVEVADAVDPAQTTRLIDGVLVDVTEVPDSADDAFGFLPGAVLVDVTARIADTGETVAFTMLDDTGTTFAAGQRVRMQAIEQGDGTTTYLVSDFRRERPLLLLFALFVFAVLSFGRLQGARALLGLGLTFGIIVVFMIPAILSGRDPVLVALVGAVVIMIVTLYLSHGFSRKTTAAVVGTAAALALTGALAVLFVAGAQLTGFTSEEARLANVEVGGLSLTGLLLAGIIIGGLGVLDDVTMSQSSAVFELHRANPALRFADLLRSALTVGRDHIAATVNTLFLAYAGASLPLLILFVVGIDPLGTIVTSEIVAVEVVRTLVGSIGLIAAVPLTTALAAGVVLGDPEAARREALLGAGHHHAVDPEPHRRGPSSRGDEGVPERPENPQQDDSGDEEEWVSRLRDAYRTRGDERPSGPGAGKPPS